MQTESLNSEIAKVAGPIDSGTTGVDEALQLKTRMNLVVVGHVDHGKSTVVGRLLSDTNSLPEGKLEQVRAKCDAAGKRFEYAFLLDALVDEQAQGITIDTARIFFQTDKRHYIILDAPGHIEFLRNMITGASHAEAALLVIDAEEGVQENSRRHGYMLSMLAVKHVIVVINKMDRVDYSEAVYQSLVKEYSEFLAKIGTQAELFIPVSALRGENLVTPAESMPWYKGATVLSALDNLQPASALQEQTLRMYVQDIYKFTKYGDERRIISGTLDSGTLRAGDTVVLYPSGKRTKVSTLESFNTEPLSSVAAGDAVGFTMTEQIYANRGDLISRIEDRKPCVSTRVQVSLFWLGQQSLRCEEEFIFRLGTARVSAKIEKIIQIVDAGNLDQSSEAQSIERNNVAECIIRFAKPVAFDEVEFLSATSRFVMVHNYRIWGGGIIRKALDDSRVDIREQAQVRDEKWIRGLISPVERAERYAQRAALILITGPAASPRKELGRALEAQLFREGRAVYFLGIGNIVHGLDMDLEGRVNAGQEHVRRLAELGNIMLDAGMLVVASAADLGEEDVTLVQELVGPDRVRVVVYGGGRAGGDIQISDDDDLPASIDKIKVALSNDRIIFSPW